MSMDFNRKANDILLKLSDIYLEEDVSFDLAIGEKLIGKAILNRVVNIVYKNLKKRHDLLDFDTVFKLLYNENIEKAELCKNNIAKLCELMQSADFSFALLKGAYLITQVYETGDRTSNDVDILINEKDVGKCRKILNDNGFIQGWVENGKVIEASRNDIVMAKMNFGETIPFIKKTENGFINIDVNFSLGYKPMEDDSIITEMLQRTVTYPYKATKLITLEDKDFIIHLCLHLYKEATTSEWVFRRKDLNLYKFNDIYILLTKKGSTEMYKKLAERITHYGVEKECYFALFHTRVIYTKLEEMEGYNEMLDIIRPSNLDYIRQIVNPLEKVVYEYNMNFLDWLACEDRKQALLNDD